MISAAENKYYTPTSTSVMNKYLPLADIKFSAPDDEIKKIIECRINSLKEHFTKGICLYSNWNQTFNAPEKLAPIIVVSSNRYKFIETNISKLWYSPNQNYLRKIFILVQMDEYENYAKIQFPSSNYTLVGWDFKNQVAKCKLMGLGPSKFVAILMAKHFNLRKVWLVEDNVIYINNFAEKPLYKEPLEPHLRPICTTTELSLTAIENKMDDKIAAIGFSGGHEEKSITKLKLEYTKSIAEILNTAEDSTKNKDISFLQDVVLWNVEYLKKENINISPYFIQFNDLSISSFLESKKHKYLLFSKAKVAKVLPEPGKVVQSKTNAVKPSASLDNNQLELQKLLAHVNEYENIQNLKILITSKKKSFSLRELFSKNGKITNENQKTICQAVEQILTTAIKQKIVDDNFLSELFIMQDFKDFKIDIRYTYMDEYSSPDQVQEQIKFLENVGNFLKKSEMTEFLKFQMSIQDSITNNFSIPSSTQDINPTEQDINSFLEQEKHFILKSLLLGLKEGEKAMENVPKESGSSRNIIASNRSQPKITPAEDTSKQAKNASTDIYPVDNRPILDGSYEKAVRCHDIFIAKAGAYLSTIIYHKTNNFKDGEKIPFCFWSGAGARDMAMESNKNGFVLESTIGSWFDKVDIKKLTGCQLNRIDLWGAMSELYAKKAAEYNKRFDFKGYVGPGAEAEQSIFNKIESPTFFQIIGSKFGEEILKNITIKWHIVPCVRDKQNKWVLDKTKPIQTTMNREEAITIMKNVNNIS